MCIYIYVCVCSLVSSQSVSRMHGKLVHVGCKGLHSELRVYDSIPSYGNPRYFQTLLDEDMMRRMKEILSGVHTAVYSLRGLEHYCVSVCLRLVKGITDFET